MTKINKNVAIVVIAVLSLIISVWVMSSINAASLNDSYMNPVF